jgi:hypothetical protein
VRDVTDRRKVTLTFFIVSGAIVFVPYVFTTLCVSISTTRYLTFTALLIFLIIALYFHNKNKIFALAIILLLVIFSLSNFNVVKGLDYHPNKGEYSIINYLKDNNLTFGYGDYWDSNIITYLSSGDVTIRPVIIGEDGLRQFRLISSDKWYEEKPDLYFLLIKNMRQGPLDASKVLVKTHIPDSIYQHNGYTIYVFNNTTGTNRVLSG